MQITIEIIKGKTVKETYQKIYKCMKIMEQKEVKLQNGETITKKECREIINNR